MAFIRTKKIKKNNYAYLVENKYMRRGNPVKQKSKKYLGRIIEPEKTKGIHFLEWIKRDPKEYLDNHNEEKIAEDLIRWELYKHDAEMPKNKVLKINHGFLCEYSKSKIIQTMHKIRQESPENKEFYEREHAVELADIFVKAGVNIPESVFIALFKKLTK